MEMEILNAIVYGSNCWSRAYILTLFANKKQGKQDDTAQFRTQLDALGLRIVEVTADGNCFFRALADQLEGNEEEHRKYRSMVVKHILITRRRLSPLLKMKFHSMNISRLWITMVHGPDIWKCRQLLL
ncbi:Cysteine proteinases superfamily protein [Trifolium repens]|nr:Cysteine proteinases superfamily protein [Trifolium repens]